MGPGKLVPRSMALFCRLLLGDNPIVIDGVIVHASVTQMTRRGASMTCINIKYDIGLVAMLGAMDRGHEARRLPVQPDAAVGSLA